VLATDGDDAVRTLEWGGLKRAYRLHVPPGAGGTPVPLLVDLHGLLSHAAFERASSGFLAVSDANGFIVVYPEALEAAWNSGDCCAATQSIDDLGFIRALVDELAASGCIDLQRVYAAGVSAGGGLAQQLACQAADKFAAVLTRDWDLLEENSADCKPARPIALLALRSRDDPRLPYAGGEIRPLNGLNATLHPLGAVKSFQRWAALDQCEDTPEDRADGCQVYAKCAAGVEVGLCTRAGAPGSIADDAAAGWEFLRRFQLP
jgi:poly(3-hydroxybutyrate) depolymerase